MKRSLIAISVFAALTGSAFPQDSGQDLAKKLANPISSLISVPFQYNLDCCFGPLQGYHNTVNIQPVVPIKLNEEWNLIVRTILPVVYWQQPAPHVGNHFGLSDTTQSFFLSPNAPTSGGIIWGIGPVFLYPTATDDSLGSRRWGAGPTVVALKQDAGWTYGILANHIWSFAKAEPVGLATGNVNQTFLQPFVNYTFPDTFGITLNTQSTYNWVTQQWTVPIYLLFSKIFKFGDQPVSFQIGPKYYAVTPNDGPRWGGVFNVTLLFPAG
jgi:hypothetical protein